MCTKKDEKNGKAAKRVLAEPAVLMTRSASLDDDEFLYANKEIVASINRSWEEMRQGNFVSKDDVIEDV